MNEPVYDHDHYYGYPDDRQESKISRLLIVISLILIALSYQGCISDDIDDIKTDVRNYNADLYRHYYRAGAYQGLRTAGIDSEQASEIADNMAESVFGS